MEMPKKLDSYVVKWRKKFNSSSGDPHRPQNDNLLPGFNQKTFKPEKSVEMYKQIQEGKFGNEVLLHQRFRGKDGKYYMEKAQKIGFPTSTIRQHHYEKRRLHENIKK